MTEAHYYNERIAHFPDGEGCLAAWLPAFLTACINDWLGLPKAEGSTECLSQ